MGFFLAVDSGGTKADYVLADETRTLARVRSATIKRMRTDEQSAAAALAGALSALEATAGVSLADVTRTCLGTAGERVPLVADWLREALRARVGGGLILVGDIEIALDAAFPGAPGVLAMAGTGSNVAVRTATGAISTFGGWGPFLADQGSGYRIGHEALRAAYLALDRGEPSVLMERILTAFELPSVDMLIAFANGHPTPDVTRLTGVVLEAANEGDVVAARVLREQGRELGELACLALRRVVQGDGEARIAFTGSILEHVAPLRIALIALVQKEFPEVLVVPGVIDPLEGALWRARTGY